jgi:quercetin dioxygenase-like cupin family protein
MLDRNGWIQPHLHSLEETFLLLEGRLTAQIGESVLTLRAGDYGLIETGLVHSWRAGSEGPVRWIEMQAPQPRSAGRGRDTYFLEGEPPLQGSPLDPKDPAHARLGHFDESELPAPGQPAQMEGLKTPPGVAVRMFVDRSFGAVHQSLFLIQYLPGASIPAHDHTFEESYYILSGEVEAVADGQVYRLPAGSSIWTGVGCIHSFANVGDQPVRWIETQAPLPPSKEVFRYEKDWAHFA